MADQRLQDDSDTLQADTERSETPILDRDGDVQPDNGYSYGSFPSYSTDIETPAPTKSAKSNTRALAPDLLRGFLMLAMALDHNALALNTWQHGTGRETEGDGTVIESWNRTAAYIVRTITHLCGTGFTFLLGMGIVYLGRSRTRLGWGSLRLAEYFAVRAVVLTLVSVVLGFILTMGQVWFFNIVLFSLAVDYFLAGLLWLVINKTEPLLAKGIFKMLSKKTDEEESERPLLSVYRENRDSHEVVQASSISWHAHNALLAVLSVVTIWWNIWLSENNGHCKIQNDGTIISARTDLFSHDEGQTMPTSPHHPFLAIWFWPVMTERIVSGFPPLAWLSFAILGLLYGRIIIARPWSTRALGVGHAFSGLLFFVLFVLTRLYHFGNLSEGCLQTPEERKHSGNPYLASPQAFFYIIKYPPDVAFWAFTMAGCLFLLAIFGAIPTRISKRFSLLLDFGTAALFFYVAHLFVVFILGRILVTLFGHDTGIANPMKPDITRGIDNLFGYFGAWALAMLSLWPMTRWYSRFKSNKPADSIWRFF